MLGQLFITTNMVLFLIYTLAMLILGIRILLIPAHLRLDSIDRFLPKTKLLPASVIKENFFIIKCYVLDCYVIDFVQC